MPGKQAKILSDQQIDNLLLYAISTRNPERNRVLVLLSLKAGLRASEIANLTWDMVVGPTNEVGLLLELHDKAAKRRSGRRVPLHPDLRAALINWQRKTTSPVGPIGPCAMFSFWPDTVPFRPRNATSTAIRMRNAS
jgi:integrase